jgi:hypothetical protein
MIRGFVARVISVGLPLVALAAVLGACTADRGGRPSEGDADGMTDAELLSEYRTQARSAEYASPGQQTCSFEPSFVDMLESALASAELESAGADFGRRVRIAGRAGALNLPGLDPSTYWPDGKRPCLRGLRVDEGPGGTRLVALLDRQGQPLDVVKMSRCLFKDIDLGFDYAIERVLPDDGSPGACDPRMARGLCRPACSEL